LETYGCKPTTPADGPRRVLRQSIVRMREGGDAEAA
jgi:hypothetical protein